MRLSPRASLTLLLAVSSLGIVGAAHAAPGTGANVINETECVDIPGGGTLCTTVKSVNKITETPSGVASAFTNSKTGSESDQAGCHISETSEFHGHTLFKDATVQENGLAVKEDGTLTCAGETLTCSAEQRFHYANGEYQFIRDDPPACTTEP